MGARNTFEALNSVVYTLATAPDGIKPRLRRALRKSMILEEDLPVHLRPNWRRLKQQIERYGPKLNPDGSAYLSAQENTLKRIRSATASRIADEILDLYFALNRYLNNGAE